MKNLFAIFRHVRVWAAVLLVGGALASAAVPAVAASANHAREFWLWGRNRDWSAQAESFVFTDSNGYRHLLGLGVLPLPEGADENEVYVVRMMSELSARGHLKKARDEVRAKAAAGSQVLFAPITHWLYLEWKNPADGKTYMVVVVGEALARATDGR